MKVLYAPLAWLADGWQADVRIDDRCRRHDQRRCRRAANSRCDERVAGPLLPGMPNLHSHAFQRAMAGLAEEALNPEDSFWTWRELMYRLVGRLTPDQVQAIATHLYIEMLKGGYTSVAEFHYLHHQPGGAHYATCRNGGSHCAAAKRPASASPCCRPSTPMAASAAKPLADKQLRFRNDVERYLKLIDGVDRDLQADRRRLGPLLPLAARGDRRPISARCSRRASRRAADPHPHRRADQGGRGLPRLVQPAAGRNGCTTMRDRRALVPDPRHPRDAGRSAACMGHSEAVVGLCPTTEANLGDGLFPAQEYLAAQRALRHRLWIRTCRSARSRNCAGWNMASA